MTTEAGDLPASRPFLNRSARSLFVSHAPLASALKRALIGDASAMLLKVTHAQLPSEPPQVAHVTSRIAAAKPHDAANVSFAAPASCIASAPLAQPGAVAPVSASASAPSAAAAPPVSAPDYGKKIFEIENVRALSFVAAH